MKNYRKAKCLIGKGEFAKVKDCIIFENGKRYTIHHNNEYGDYVMIDDPNNKYGMFIDAPLDMYNVILSGEGDCIEVSKVLTTTEHVVYFLNREIGEKIREKFLSGWKNTKFGYSVKCGYINSFSGLYFVNNNLEKISAFDNQISYVTFDSKNEANEFVKDINKKAKELAQIFIDNYDKEKDNFKYCISLAEKIVPNLHETIYFDIIFDMLDNTYKNFKKDDREVKLKVVQCIIHDKEEIKEKEYKARALFAQYRLKVSVETAEEILRNIKSEDEIASVLKKYGVEDSEENIAYLKEKIVN